VLDVNLGGQQLTYLVSDQVSQLTNFTQVENEQAASCHCDQTDRNYLVSAKDDCTQNPPVCGNGTLGSCGNIPQGSLPVNGRQVTCSDNLSTGISAEFKAMWEYLKYGKFYCEMTDAGARLAIKYTAIGEEADRNLYMDLSGKCLNEEYNTDGSVKDGGPKDHRELCLVQFGPMVIGCARANLHEKQRNQAAAYANDSTTPTAEETIPNFDFAKKVDKENLLWSEWHAFWGWTNDTRQVPEPQKVNKHINLLLFAPQINLSHSEADDAHLFLQADYTAQGWPVNRKKYEWCTCPSGTIALVLDSSGSSADCSVPSSSNLCENGFSTCVDYSNPAMDINLVSK
jgi:hypothetical protein